MTKSVFKPTLIFIFLVLLAACKKETKQELKIVELFSDHMVLQQGSEITIWGTCTPKDEVQFINPWGEDISTFAEENGNWSLKVLTPKAGGPFELKLTTDDQTIVLKDVLIGEVWLASGQSNMEMPLTGYLPNEPVNNYQQEIANANYENIRFINVERAISRQALNKINGKWNITSSQTADKFSATAYFFARKLYKELNVPIGIIHSSWGGTPVEAWMSHENLLKTKEFDDKLSYLKSSDTTDIVEFLSNYQSLIVPNDSEVLQHLSFDDDAFSSFKFDHSQWSKTMLPGDISNDEAPIGKEGVFWFRKEVTINDITASYTLDISGGIDDADVSYFNGKKIGNSECWDCPRSYTIPKSILKKGKNIIAIRLINLWGNAGFKGNIALNNKENHIDITGEWFVNPIAAILNSKGHRKFFVFHNNYKTFEEKIPQIESYKTLNNPNYPTVLYNAMIHPLISYKIKGAIWYQGESNVGRAAQYNILFPKLIEDWRSVWKEDLSFYYVQIAPFDYGNGQAAILRDAQRRTLKIPKTGMAITMDIGHEKSIHPGNKQDVGSRLARLALVNDYNKKMVSHGPIYQDYEVDRNTLILNFNGVGSGLMAKDNILSGFEIAGEDLKFKKATAKILDDKIIVRSWGVRNPVHVRYGWKDFFEGTLFNKDGLPASSFSTEDWRN